MRRRLRRGDILFAAARRVHDAGNRQQPDQGPDDRQPPILT